MSASEKGFDPRLKALYLVGLAVGVFFLPRWWMVGAVALCQAVLWLALGLGAGALFRQVRKLSLFLGVIFIAYSLVTHDPATDEWRTLSLFGFDVDVNLSGALVGLTMVLRVLAVVLASQVARAGDPRALAQGLRRLGVPRSAALSIDAVLALVGERKKGGGRGTGGGKGGGGGRNTGGGKGGGDGEAPEGFWVALKRLARGDVGILAERLRTQVARAEEHLAGSDEAEAAGAAFRRDVAVVAGIALTMLGVKMLKLLPGLPFAPGHKGVLLIPLYIVAGFMTRSRAGATLTGITMGTVAFLLGDGRYGVFEIAKHITPGVLVDLLLPLARRRRSVFAWSLVGLVVALGRFATVVVIALTVQAPAVVYAFLVPGLIVHGTFGVLSGLITAPLLRALENPEDNGGTIPSKRPRKKKGRREAA